jgi:flagellar biogenesis protein FliO
MTQPDIFTVAYFLRAITALVFVCVLAALSLKIIAPYLKARETSGKEKMRSSNKSNRFKLMERMKLDDNNDLLLINFAGNDLLLASGKNGVQLLGALSKENQINFDLNDVDDSSKQKVVSLVNKLNKQKS